MTSVHLVPPHGGKLLPLLVTGEERNEALSEARTLPQVRPTSKEVSDLIMLAMGAFSPLQGFMGREDYERVVSDMRLKNCLLWPIPITLSASREEADNIKEGQKIALLNSDNVVITSPLILCISIAKHICIPSLLPQDELQQAA